jgi:nucleoid-associated protein YgaU
MISIIIYAILAAGAAFAAHEAWTGFVDRVSAPRVQAQIAADQKVIDAAEARAKLAETNAATANGNLDSCRQASQAQSEAFQSWQEAAQKALGAAREARTAAAKAATAQAPYIADLQAKAAAAPKLQNCEAELKQATDVIREELKRRRGK